MTREDAKRILNRVLEEWVMNDDVSIPREEALRFAIKALEQEPIAQERYEDLCEYFGDAKVILNSRDDFKAWLDRVKWYIRKAEELYEKYEKEPSGDLISRQAVQDYIAKYLSQYLYDDVREAVEVIDEYIGELPSVNPQEPNIDMESEKIKILQKRAYLEGFHEAEKMLVKQEPKTGHWILRPHIYGVAFCSECGYELKINNTNYCPNCGARMESEE